MYLEFLEVQALGPRVYLGWRGRAYPAVFDASSPPPMCTFLEHLNPEIMHFCALFVIFNKFVILCYALIGEIISHFSKQQSSLKRGRQRDDNLICGVFVRHKCSKKKSFFS